VRAEAKFILIMPSRAKRNRRQWSDILISTLRLSFDFCTYFYNNAKPSAFFMISTRDSHYLPFTIASLSEFLNQ